MKKRAKSIVALLLTMLMVVGLIPTEFVPVKVKAAETTYTFDASIVAGNIDKKAAVSAGIYGTENYFTIEGKATRGNSSTFSVELAQTEQGKLSFVVASDNNAKAVVTMSSTGGTNTTDFALLDANGQVVPEKTGAKGVTGNTGLDFTFENLASGKYTLVNPKSATNARGLRVLKMVVTQTPTGQAEGKAPDVETATASLKSDTTNVATVSWKLKSQGDGDGELLLDVIKDGTAIQTGVKLDQAATSYDYEMTSSGAYTFKVYGRLGSDANEGVTTTPAVSYTLPLGKPVVTAKAGDGKVALSWKKVAEATGYTVAYKVGNGEATSIDVAAEATSYDVTGLTNLTTYSFTVTANRADDKAASDEVECMPYKPIDTSSAVPGLDIVNQSADNQVSISRTGGVISFSQPATGGGIASGGITNSSFALTPNAISGDFTMSADITIDALPSSGSGTGIFFGAFTGTGDKDKLATIAVRGDKQFNAYRTKNEAESTYENGGSKKGAATIGKKYTYTLTRSGETISYSVKDGDSVVTDGSWGIKTGKDFVDFSEALKGDVRLGFVICNATVTIEKFKISSGGSTVFDSTTLTGSFSSFVDNWDSVKAPVISVEGQKDKMTVTSDCIIGPTGAGTVTVEMKDSTGKVVGTKSSSVNGTQQIFEFAPEFSGDYTFVATASRPSVDDKKISSEGTIKGFVSTLHGPENVTATSQGSGNVKVEWDSYKEATGGYKVSYKTEAGTEYTVAGTTNDTTYTVTGLTVDTKYEFKVEAIRGEESAATTTTATATADAKAKWQFSAYGSSTDTKNNGFTGDANDGSVTVYSEGGKGKIVPASTDGLAFYYTQVPSNQNFVLKARVHADKWTLSNGQEGFGLMAADRVAKNGNGTAFWNNSYQAIASKVEYYYNAASGAVAEEGDKISMKLGIGVTAKTGVTKENLSKFEASDNDTIVNSFNSETVTLDTSAGKLGTGTYNVIANGTNERVSDGLEPIEEYNMTITKNNTGYWITYSSIDGSVVKTQKYYDTEALSQIDKENVYVGFFASRNARATFSDISLEIRDPKDDPAPEARPIKYVTPKYSVTSPTATGSDVYEFTFVSNADGWLTVPELGVTGAYVKDGEKFVTKVKIEYGSNSFEVSFRPDPDFVPAKGDKLSSYATATFTHTVLCKKLVPSNQPIYVSPDALDTGLGTKESPVDVYTAVKYVQPGQKILLAGGEYKLDRTITIARGINGTSDGNMYMIADPASTERPVFNFQGICAGMVIAGNYWTLSGFDVTNSANAQKGIQVSGNNNVLSEVNAYHNGNTGIQISRYLSTDTKKDWPSNNLILNCTSYGNADKGYEDADGFAAKLTVGDGNVFDGCIAHHNADDGWDLFAKVETGSIGSVTIKNSVAYANGYLENGTNAGNGNGFKMGGDSLSGYHKLINSVAFDNKAKGIDSNSCPDIQVTNCTTFNNGSYNVAFYTNTAANTDYSAEGVLSYRSGTSVEEQIKVKGTQDNDKIYKDTNYYWDKALSQSKNKSGEVADDTWFVSLDTSKVPTRNGDGTVNMNGLLELTDKAPANVGARVKSASSSGIVDRPSTPDTTPDTSSDDDGTSSEEDTTESITEEVGIPKPSEISGASSTQLNGTEFSEIGQMTDGAANIVASIGAEGKVKDSIKVSKTTEEASDTIISKIRLTPNKEIVSYVSENASITKSVFDKLKETGKTLTLGIVDKEGKVTAIVSIDGNKLTKQSVVFNLNITANVKNSSINKIADKAGVKEANYTVIDFKHSGTLPGTIKVAVDTSKKFADGTKLALYYYNKDKGTLDNQYQITTVTNGYAEFAINHCSQYVLVEVSAAQDTLTSSNTLGSPKTADIASIFGWLMLMCIAGAVVICGFKMSKKRV